MVQRLAAAAAAAAGGGGAVTSVLCTSEANDALPLTSQLAAS